MSLTKTNRSENSSPLRDVECMNTSTADHLYKRQAFCDRPQSLPAAVRTIAEQCTGCGLCRKDCRFLQNYGLPVEIAAGYSSEPEVSRAAAFACSLCGLCTAVCPVGIDPAVMFLELRRDAFLAGNGDLAEHARLLNYERKGTSKRYSWYALPEGCDTVFFPGCTLPGTRPKTTGRIYELLLANDSKTGIVLDCCSKPSHDLGRQEHFEEAFFELCRYLTEAGVKKVIVACPNCYKVFAQYGLPLTVETVYQYLAAGGMTAKEEISGTVTVHDPCVIRTEGAIHQAARSIISAHGLKIREMEHAGERTLCCGEGGAVGCVAGDLSEQWGRLRKQEASGDPIVTYCAGCAGMLNGLTPTIHILDLIFAPEQTLAGKVPVAKAPFTYLNRLRLKKNLQRKSAAGATTRERDFKPAFGSNKKKQTILRLLVLLTLVAGIWGIRTAGISEYLDQDKFRTFIGSLGILGPLFYMLIYSVAPSLFLPGLPLTIAGGILFGPVWGVVYTIVGATAGACLAFLISRYMAGNWIDSRLSGPRWRTLQQNVEEHGWKIVAFTRLVPLFPFNLLNYAFGLTRIKFMPYALATALCMLPACIAFIVFSSSLLDLFKGKITYEFAIGLTLILLVSLAPLYYRKFQLKRVRLERRETK